jgi:hypothetical protein
MGINKNILGTSAVVLTALSVQAAYGATPPVIVIAPVGATPTLPLLINTAVPSGPHQGISHSGGGGGDQLGAQGAFHDINAGLGDLSDWVEIGGVQPGPTAIVGLAFDDQGTFLNRLNSANTNTIAAIVSDIRASSFHS